MILGIDASNIRTGGGLTHLKNLLKFTTLSETTFSRVVIWSSNDTLNQLPDLLWLIKKSHPLLNKSVFETLLFQILILSKEAKREKCSIIFSPGGTFLCGFRPFVTMSQNMLPFELNEAFRFKKIKKRLRFLALRLTQTYTFQRADGLIFLTEYSKRVITNKLKNIRLTCIIPHGIDPTFSQAPLNQLSPGIFNTENRFTFLYVSIVTAYKHQWNVAEAIFKLNQELYPVDLLLIGPKEEEGFSKLRKVLDKNPFYSQFISYLGAVEHSELFNYYNTSNAFVFASTCENMPIILIEAMSAGLPIASSNRGPMPEVLGAGGVYFDPENKEDIYLALKELFLDTEKRQAIADIAYKKAINYSWKNCAHETLAFLSLVSKEKHKVEGTRIT